MNNEDILEFTNLDTIHLSYEWGSEDFFSIILRVSKYEFFMQSQSKVFYSEIEQKMDGKLFNGD